LFFDGHWGCRVCLKLEYPTTTVSGHVVAAYQIRELQRGLIAARPGSQRKAIFAQIAEQHRILTADVRRIRRDLQRRLKNDYRRS
jgi:hypothetical protein